MLPALVEPGPPLSGARLARYSRQIMLPQFGEAAQRRLANARVLVVGAGGLGSASIPYLASAGVGTIGVADDDAVELSNLHRQVAHSVDDVGRLKVDSIAATVAAIDPDVSVRAHDLRLNSANIMGVLEDYDLVLDGSDNFPTRYLTNDATALAHKPLVWGAILRYSGQASVAWADAGPTYRDLFPQPPAPGDVPSCSEAGVLPGVCAVIGAIMATEALKLITGIGEPLIGRVTTYDALTGRYRELDYTRDPNAKPITELIDYAAFCGLGAPEQPAAVSNAEPDRLTPEQLATRLAAGEPLQLIDVRQPFEAAIARIEGSDLIPLHRLSESLARIRTDVPVVLYCHHGPRSQRAAALLRRAGVSDVTDLAGGIDAYAREIDPALARY